MPGSANCRFSIAIKIAGARNTDQYPNIAFRWTPDNGFEDLNGTSANAINDAGKVAGSTITGVFVLDGNSYHSWNEQYAYGINDSGQVVGYSESASGNLAFVWDQANDMQDLNSLVTANGWVLSSAAAVNNDGDIVGTGLFNGQPHGFLLTSSVLPPPPPPVNEPPVAVATSDVSSGKVILTVNFQGDQSSDPDGSIVEYGWDFGDGTGSTGLNPSHDYDVVGTYICVLTVTDDKGMTDSAQLDITVRKSGGKPK